MSTTTGIPTLSPAQVERFHREGWLGPFTLCSPEEMAVHRAAIEDVVAHDCPEGLNDHHSRRGHNRHLDDGLLWRIASDPALVGRMRAVLGDDLLLWRTNFFTKEPGGKEIPWHQDWNYWPLEPALVCSAWLAIDEVDAENSCVQIIPGSHRRVLNHITAPDTMSFAEMADTHGIDLSKKVDIPLRAGEFFLFNERTLHHSEANRSQRRRMGLAIRVITPQVRLLEWDGPLHRLAVLSGSDRLGFNGDRVVERCPIC